MLILPQLTLFTSCCQTSFKARDLRKLFLLQVEREVCGICCGVCCGAAREQVENLSKKGAIDVTSQGLKWLVNM